MRMVSCYNEDVKHAYTDVCVVFSDLDNDRAKTRKISGGDSTTFEDNARFVYMYGADTAAEIRKSNPCTCASDALLNSR